MLIADGAQAADDARIAARESRDLALPLVLEGRGADHEHTLRSEMPSEQLDGSRR